MKQKRQAKFKQNALFIISERIQTFFFNITSFLKNIFINILKVGKKYPRFFEVCQLSVIYLFAILQVLMSCIQVFGSGNEISKFFPFLVPFINSPFQFLISNPEKTYVVYILTQELIILRSSLFNFSILVRYNILYVMLLEFSFFCLINWWETFSSFEKDLNLKANIVKAFPQQLGLTIFCIYFMLYLYSYFRAINKKLPEFKNPILQKIPDSVAFWLQLKKQTPEEKIPKNLQ